MNLRIRLFLLSLGCCLYLGGTTPPNEPIATSQIEWLSLEEVQVRMERSPKLVIVDVYTTWCSWCKVMDSTTFRDPEVIREMNRDFYAVKLLAESYKELNLKGEMISKSNLSVKWGVEGYPTFVVLDTNLEPIRNISGYRKPKAFLKELEKLMKKVE